MTDTPQQPTGSSRRLPMAVLVMVAVLAGVTVALLALTLLGRPESPAAGTDPSPTPTASASDTSAQPTASAPAAPTPEPTPEPLAAGSIAVVTVNDLNVREHPASDAKSYGHLSAGTRVFVVRGPEQAGGYAWYQVATVDWADRDAPCAESCPRGGWVAGAAGTQEGWLAPAELDCPSRLNARTFARLDRFERLACYGDQQLSLEGVTWTPCCGYVGVFIYEPSWLSWPTSFAYLSSGRPMSYGGVELRFKPGAQLPVPEYADIIKLTGHLDDPAASKCTITVDQGMDSPPAGADPEELAFAPIGCRTEFVVDSIEILGNTGEKCTC